MLIGCLDSGDVSVPSRTGAPSTTNAFPRSWTQCNVEDASCPELVWKANQIMQQEIHSRHMQECPHDNTLVTIELDPTLSAAKIFDQYPERATRAQALLTNRVRAR